MRAARRLVRRRNWQLATERLGFYSDLQSLNSEDAVTWSYFGWFLAEPPAGGPPS